MIARTPLNPKQRTWLMTLQSEDTLLLLIGDGLNYIDDDCEPAHPPWVWHHFQIKKWIRDVITNDGYVPKDVEWLNTLRSKYFEQTKENVDSKKSK